MFSNRSTLELLELGNRILPSAIGPPPPMPGGGAIIGPLPPVPGGGGVVQHIHPFHGIGTATYLGNAITVDAGTSFTLTGTADLGAMGMFQVQGSLHGVGMIANGRAMGQLVLSNAHGTITLALHGRVQPGFAAIPNELVYSVSGGTGDFQHLTGYGVLGVKMTPAPIAPGQPPTGIIDLKFG